MRNIIVLSLTQLSELSPDSGINDYSIRGLCNAYIVLLATRKLSQAQIVGRTGFSLSMVSSCFNSVDVTTIARVNYAIYGQFSSLTSEELVSLRSEMQNDGKWMRARLRELRVSPSKKC
jgi:hypothetical protein